MISPERAGLLKSFLGSLPEQIAERLARAVEVDRLVDGKSLPHELILESLRPSLRRLSGSERTPTALRFFCLPFEDLFTVAPQRTRKQKGRIARGSVAPIWTWVSQTLLPREAKLYCRNFKAALVAGNHAGTRTLAEAFWIVAANAMRAALAEGVRRDAARAALGSDLVVGDAEEAALLLAIGAAVEQIQEMLVKPVPVLSDELLSSLREVQNSLMETEPEAAPYVAAIAMNRLARPWEALKLSPNLEPSGICTAMGTTDMGLAGEIIFADLGRYADAVRAAQQPLFDADALIENTSRFTTLASGMLRDAGMRDEGTWKECLRKQQIALAEVMEAFMVRAPKEFSQALPSCKSATALDEEKVERALRYARLVMGCKAFAVAGAFGPSLKQAEQQMLALLRSHSDALVEDVRSADAPRRALVERQFEIDVRLTAVLLSEADAEFLRRRMRAALRVA